jgi:DNA-binding transcriptional MerR regulator/methylmalonyl-CoA mutase cobalamin-binding subunit
MTIQQLSQETGIGIDTLRIWERRYGVPVPARDTRGHRTYTHRQAEELLVVKKLQNLGQRPGKIFALDPRERRELLDCLAPHKRPGDERLQLLIEEMSPREIAAELAGQRIELGLSDFIHHCAMPLLQLLDHGWTAGQLSIAREHLVSDQLENLLKLELAKTTSRRPPQILFLTLTGERHKIGLLLAAVLFQGAGLQVLWLSEELPLSEIPKLATDLEVAGVALSFSSHYPSRQAKQDLGSLRRHLNPRIKIIAGGHAVQKISSMPNLLICTNLKQIPQLARRHFHNYQKREEV